MFLCMSRKISNCVMEEAVNFINNKTKPRYTYCGVVALNGRHTSSMVHILTLKTHPDFIFNLEFNKFYFEWRRKKCQEHNTNVLDVTTKTNAVFCGKRMPWTMITANKESYIHITLSKYREYDVVLFYSTYRPQWLKEFSQRQMVHLNTSHVLHLSWLNIFRKVELHKSYMHVIVDPWMRIAIHVSWNPSAESNTTLVIHDGPGRLSPYIGIFSSNSKTGAFKITTGTFSAFIQLEHQLNEKVNVKIEVVAGLQQFPLCAIDRNSFRISSNKQSNTVCVAKFKARGEAVRGGTETTTNARMKIVKFTYDGPHIIVDDAPHNCQYGGMYIANLIDQSDRMIPICESRQDFVINSRYNQFAVLVVFHRRYSYGDIYAAFFSGSCLTSYLELTNYPDYYFKESFTMDDSIECQVFVCAPQEIEGQKSCNIKLNTPSGAFGTVHLVTTMLDNIFSCVPEFYKSNTENIFHLKTISSEAWPLGKPKLTDVTQSLPLSKYHESIFIYLHNASISFHSVCLENRQRQLMVLFQQSVCQQTVSGKFYISSVDFVQALSKYCFKHKYTIKHHIENASHIIYKEGTGIHAGGVLHTKYGEACPSKCKKYKFVLLVWRRSENSIYEYKADVGDRISTGTLHNGFRLTILPPPSQCACNIGVTMERLEYAITEKYLDFKREKIAILKNGLQHLYSKR